MSFSNAVNDVSSARCTVASILKHTRMLNRDRENFDEQKASHSSSDVFQFQRAIALAAWEFPFKRIGDSPSASCRSALVANGKDEVLEHDILTNQCKMTSTQVLGNITYAGIND